MSMLSQSKLTLAGLALALALLAGCAAQPAEEVPAGGVEEPPAPTVPVEPEEPEEPEPPEPTVATLAVCGDVMSHMPVTNDAWGRGRRPL